MIFKALFYLKIFLSIDKSRQCIKYSASRSGKDESALPTNYPLETMRGPGVPQGTWLDRT